MVRLQVGIAGSCVAPLWVERVGLRVAKLSGVDSMTVPDHYTGFVPRALWKPEDTPAAKQVDLVKFMNHTPVFVNNQFGPETLDVKKPSELCVPALKNP